MGESLKLDGARTLTPNDTDITSNVSYPARVSGLPASSDTVPPNTIQYVYYSAQNVFNYNWYAVTAGAGTGALKDTDVLNSSICPKGWRLPSHYEEHWQTLLDTYAIARESSTAAPNAPLITFPFDFVYGENWMTSYWYNDRLTMATSTAAGSDSRWPTTYYTAYTLTTVSPSRVDTLNYHKQAGRQIRCFAR